MEHVHFMAMLLFLCCNLHKPAALAQHLPSTQASVPSPSVQRSDNNFITYPIPGSNLLIEMNPTSSLSITRNTFYTLLTHARTDLQAKAALRGGLDQLVEEEYRYPESFHYSWRLEMQPNGERGTEDWPTYRDFEFALTGLHNAMPYISFHACYFRLLRRDRQGRMNRHDIAHGWLAAHVVASMNETASAMEDFKK